MITLAAKESIIALVDESKAPLPCLRSQLMNFPKMFPKTKFKVSHNTSPRMPPET
jgi:hypothetical protein